MRDKPGNSSSLKSLDRRKFLKAAGAAIVLPTILPGSVLGRGGKAPPSRRITMATVGWGVQGPGDCRSFLGNDDCRMVAVCDIDRNHLQAGVDTINQHYGNSNCAGYFDYREMLARPDLDAVLIAVPDNWHALVAIEAARRGLDIYGEKPLARTIAEQQAIVKAVKRANIIWQTGSWQRSGATFRKAAEIVRNGLIGEVTRVEVGLPGGWSDNNAASKELKKKLGAMPGKITDLSKITPATTDEWNLAVCAPPPELDYETWIGPARMEPCIPARLHWNWRWNYNTGGGQLLDWIGHHCDIAHWGLDFDNSGPSEIEGHGEFPAKDAIFNTSPKYRIELKYPRNIPMVISGGHDDIRGGIKWIGTEGWVWVDREGFEGSNPEWKKTKNLPEALRKVKLYESSNHYRNFLDCVLSRKPTITPVETAHHSAIPGHLGLISMLTGRKIRWSVKEEKILDDAEAGKMLARGYRAPWHLA
ncbi:MAG TPA: Gfo/Idh/MocA family oxidoreductase [Candidatus Polarisedimenticolia bacterium]|nr:Gfo/Idh/MocA family oxidoreductase [Candidatus Polarisedimenticolia bacterium]